MPMKRNQAEEWITFFMKLNGRYGTFLLGDPTGMVPRGVATGTPFFASNSQTGNEIVLAGFTANVQSIMRAGDYIQVGSLGGSRLYKVLENAFSTGSGTAQLLIWPNLRTMPASGDLVKVNSCQGVFRLAHNEMPWALAQAQVYGLTFAAIEVIA